MTRIIKIFFLVTTNTLFAQVNDSFEDGDFTTNPSWSGDDSEFTVDGSNQLRLGHLDPAPNNESYLSLTSTVLIDGTWEFKVGFDGLSSGGLSGSNKMFIYLTSDKADLEDSPNGYYVLVGNSNDEISLYSTTSSTPIIDGVDDLTQFGSEFISVRVTRDALGNWELLTDTDGGSTFTSQGTTVNTDFTTSSFFGVLCDYSQTRRNSFFFDDFDVTGPVVEDIEPPTVQELIVISSSELDVTFSESVDRTTSEIIDNYTLDGGIEVAAAAVDELSSALVHLTTSAMTNGTSYTLTLSKIEDENGNVIALNSRSNYEYVVFEEAAAFDVVINEFMPDPNPVIGLPNAEFVELYNRSENFLNLESWQLDGQTLSRYKFTPDSYLIVCDDDDLTLFSAFPNVLAVSSLSLSNLVPDEITLLDDNAIEIHSISFEGSVGGKSTELINPNGPSYSRHNYGLSIDVSGGTPGQENSIFDDTPDAMRPTVLSLKAFSSSELQITFSESIDNQSGQATSNYSIDGGVLVKSAEFHDGSNSVVKLCVSTLSSTEKRLLSIKNIQDYSGNVIESGTELPFIYIETVSALPGDVVANEFMANPLSDGGATNGEFIELLNNSKKYFELENWTVSDASGTSAGFSSRVFGPGELLILAPSNNPSTFDENQVLIVSNFRSLNNNSDDILLKDELGTVIFDLSYSYSELGKSTELINPNDPCISELSYAISTATSGSTPGELNAVFNDDADLTPPLIVSSNFNESLTLNFSETMDAVSLISGNYDVTDLTVTNLSAGIFPSSVDVFFAETLLPGTIYDVTVSELTDCWGNTIKQASFSFGIGRAPSFNEVLITEIFSDPDPTVGLPEVEFVEIYNSTSELISTEGLVFSDAATTATFPIVTLLPFEYYVLTSPAGVSKFTNAKVIGLPGLPSLQNAGEQLYLSRDSELIFSVNYSNEWHDQKKSDGGYSLEMKDINNPCVAAFNWASSIDPTGGTPGFPSSNSEPVPDNFGPQITKALALSEREIFISFDENIDPSAQVGSVIFEPGLSIASLDFRHTHPKSLFVTLNEDLVENSPHSVQVGDVTDCNGNNVQPMEVVVALPSSAEIGDLLLSEVLFNPRANGVDFVEIHNTSSKYLNLSGWQFARITATGIEDEKVISANALIIEPGEYLAFTTDREILLDNYPQSVTENLLVVNSLPTYSNDSGNVVLIDHLGEVQELFHYDDDYHYNLLESTDGVSLERISLTAETNNLNNWRSASSVSGFATPGARNSQAISESDRPARVLEVEPKMFIPGNSGSGRDFTTINYQFDKPGKFANITIYDQMGRLIKTVAEGALLSTSGFVRWDGTTNEGELARLGYYVVLFEVYDSSGNSDIFKETVVVGRNF